MRSVRDWYGSGRRETSPRRGKLKKSEAARAAHGCVKRTNIPQVARKFIREGVGKRVNGIHRRRRQPRMSGKEGG